MADEPSQEPVSEPNPESKPESTAEPTSFKKEEFSGKNVKKGLGQSAIVLVGILLAVFASRSGTTGLVFGVLAILVLGYSIFQSMKDQSKLKWLNIAIKALFILLAIYFIVT